MSSLHPDWHETNQEEQVVPVHGAKDDRNLPEGIPVSRKPAAILGMLIVSSLAFTYYHSSSSIKGQVTDSAPIIHIKEDGIDPQSITVQQGQTVTWINEQAIPHIIESTDLCNADGACLYTPTVFPGEQVDFEISVEIAAGTYSYSSVTSEDVTGEIIVTATRSTPEPQDAQDPSPGDLTDILPPPPVAPTPPDSNEPPENNIPSNQLSDIPETATTPPSPPNPQNTNIPTNPNVGKYNTPDTNIAGTTNHNGAPPTINSVHKPLQQPQTGASSWIVFILSIAGLTWVTRRAFSYNLQ
ncbi:MAG: hypothetical protein K9M03_01650 [Kiritimatiellales bacterium]|nr:hypothetical protein [Kiritimatiellales bacterium]